LPNIVTRKRGTDLRGSQTAGEEAEGRAHVVRGGEHVTQRDATAEPVEQEPRIGGHGRILASRTGQFCAAR
jgi:hypothetical protein